MASHETVEGRPVQMGDFVQVDYEAVSENKPLAEMLEEDNGLAKGEATWLPVKENVLAPGFHKGLVGKEIGEKCEIQVDFDEHFSEQGLEGKKAVYFVEIKAIRGQKKPELDDAFAKEAGAESMESLRDALKTEIQQYKQNEEHNRHADVIVDKLLSSVNFDLPESVVNEETRHSIYNIVQSNTRRGVSSEEIQEKKDEIYAAATRSAKDKVKLRYILHRIADEENIKVTSAEVQGYLRMMAMRYGMDPETLTQKMEEENRLNEIEESIRQKKTLDFLIEEAQVSV
jgi:trigger factor